MNVAFELLNSKALVLAYQLALKNNKKKGDGMAEELIEVAKRHPTWVKILGETEMDADLLSGNLREQGKKVLNMNEVQRKREQDEKNN